MKKANKGFTLIELIIVIAILGIIALIAIPNLAGIRQRSQVSADIRTAEQIGKAIRIWATDVDAGNRDIPAQGTIKLYTDTTVFGNLCPDYIGAGYTAKSYGNPAGKFFVSSVGAGVNNAEQKIIVGIDVETATDSKIAKVLATDTDGLKVTYNGGAAGWAYFEQ